MKTKIKRMGLFVLALVMAVSLALAFAGCGDGGVTVTFDLNYEGAESIEVKTDDGAVTPPDVARDGYMFDGWYADAACTVDFDFSETITESTTAYAGWIEREAGKVYISLNSRIKLLLHKIFPSTKLIEAL